VAFTASAPPQIPPHLSALHFSAIVFFPLFPFFGYRPKNHLSVFSVSRKKEKKTKKRTIALFLLFAAPILTARGRAV
jgi:hypothetical protein